MPVNAKTIKGGGGGNFVKQEAMKGGPYPARIVQIINFGLQPQRAFKGKEKEPRIEVGWTYEFLDEFCKDEEGKELTDRPRWVSEDFPVYNMEAEKAKSTQRMKAIDPDDNLDGDLLKPINFPVIVTITKEEGRGDKKGTWFNNVSNLAPMRDKDAEKAPELVNEPIVFDVDEPDMEVWDRLSERNQKKCKGNLNFKGSKLEELLAGYTPKERSEAKKQEEQAETPAPQDDTPADPGITFEDVMAMELPDLLKLAEEKEVAVPIRLKKDVEKLREYIAKSLELEAVVW